MQQDKKQESLIKYGDIFKLGEHLLLYGDATDKELINKFIKGRKIKEIICDPPFGVAAVESKIGFKQKMSKPKPILNDQLQTKGEYTEFSKKWLEPVLPNLTDKNALYIFNASKMISALGAGLEELGLTNQHFLIWLKNQAVLGRSDYLPQYEFIVYTWKGRREFVRSKAKGVFFYPKPQKSKFHPTTKPVGLIRELILNSSRIGDTIYDCFLGSGTTLLAAEQTKRKCLAVELDPEYVQTAIDRFYSLTGIKAKKL